MSSTMSAPSDDAIDPAWWENTIGAARDLEQPEALATEFEARLRQNDLGELERQVIEGLAVATSAMLRSDNWLEPFKPAIVLDDRRSALPIDLTPDQIALLARIAPMIRRRHCEPASPTSPGCMATAERSTYSRWR
jgi:hypothetical protein